MKLIGITLLLTVFLEIDGKCSRLPSGNCWVNCMQDIFDVICNACTSEMVRSDLSVFADTSQQLRLYICNSPLITRLSADVFAPVASQILLLDLQDVDFLDTFPELYELNNLYRFSVWNSPRLTKLSLELLPRSVHRLALNKVGVTHFRNDFTDLGSLPNLAQFVVRNSTIRGWQPDFLNTFPKLELLEISNSTIDVRRRPLPSATGMADVHMITKLTLHNNILTANSLDKSAGFLTALLASVKILPGSNVDISMNNLTINDRERDLIPSFQHAKRLNMRGNRLVFNARTLEETREAYIHLEELDLGQTNLLPIKGMFGGFPNLRTLKLDHNNLQNFSEIDIFEGSTCGNLSHIDLSYNEIRLLPSDSTLTRIAPQVLYLNLEGNHLQVFRSNTSLRFEQQDAIFGAFSNLEILILSRNNFSEFYGFHLAGLTKLRVLDISCNPFDFLRKEAFTDLPPSLVDVDVSMCIVSPAPSPWIDWDVFTTLPPLKILRLRSGAYNKWIFKTLNFTTNTSNSLEELYLDDNDITFLRKDSIPRLPNLRTLSMSRNMLQSLSAGLFTSLPNLTRLNLKENRIGTIPANTFSSSKSQLQLLEELELSENGLSQIYRGAFDGLPKLRSLMLGGNSAEVQDIFDDGGKKLEYFGIQGYNHSCLRAEFFDQLPNLRWIFPDHFNLVLAYPDERLFIRDTHLESLLEVCQTGIDTADHETYPGLREYISVTIHDTDEGTGLQYPMLAAFLPLNYCPSDNYVAALAHFICSNASTMER
ncbi:hypothetical protein BV898_07522 [Hypsibius exemplaris]|uniref:Insulin-like growth factor-binding protein complex acid labile subunit n=1 Tax=Hypsibius exemplaris TaxID=2072580 RepID=A0A1W0WSY3_HYPEX|nr:hypothetical protein BV898_07522 [Hypsibius exemplaris]